MSEKQGLRSIAEIMNEMLSTVREYYDSEYAYYIEKDGTEILTVYEWCAENIPWQRDRIKMLGPSQMPKWLKHDITDTTEDSYSVSRRMADGTTAVLAAVGVHRGGCELSLLWSLLPYITQIIEMQKQYKHQEYLSYYDNLTGLLNRNSFVGYLNTVKTTELKALGALSADINGLKNFNKEFGRAYGDEVVMRVGEVLSEQFRGASIFRLTGDEYLVVLENISYESFMKCVNAARETLDNISLGLVTMGYAWEKLDIQPEALISRAESMMREEKQKYYKHLKKGHHEPIIKEDLLNDIEEGNFIVCFVPVIDAHTEEVASAEAVVRYHHKDLGTMDLERYLTMLEETNLSRYLDLYVFSEVCKTLRRWENEGRPMIPVSVNLTASTLRQTDIVDKLLSMVEQYHVPCEYLEVEVAESSHEMNQEMLAETSNKIRKGNIRVLLDHFGVRDSTLSILSIMEFDGLKLDKSLVDTIVGSVRSQIVAKAVIDICSKLGASVLAAGVETQDQLNMLKELGCSFVQGPLFNKPITIETFEMRYMRD